MYDPIRGERDACGLGFAAHAGGEVSRSIVDAALEGLCRVRHRGATAADALTGDGAGLLLPIPRSLLSSAGPEGFGVAMLLLDPDTAVAGSRLLGDACDAERVGVASWRDVPVNEHALGSYARHTLPVIRQALLVPPGDDARDNERAAFRVRRRLERAARERGGGVYAASLSFRTVTYKALCAADQLASFYPDLSDPRCEAWFAIFHQRYSTNTSPTWERAQPFRMLAHNGEINTIRGNVAAMRAREGSLGSTDLAPEDLLAPSVDPSGSDSAILDEALELLARGGRSLTHAAEMLVPPAWEHEAGSDPANNAFFAYNASLMEPWDGPAALVFGDGDCVGATLDRNGLRPLRVAICDDGFVSCASEAGAVPLDGHGRVCRTKLGPGGSLCVDPALGGVLDDEALKRSLARRRPYGRWIAESATRCSPGHPAAERPADLRRRHVAAGFTKEELTVVLRPMAIEGREPTSSMGDDTPQPSFARKPRPVFGFLKQRFAQVTNPAIDHLRERHVMSLTTRLGPRAPLLQEQPGAPALREYPSFVLFPSAIADLVADGAALLDATLDPLEGPEGLREGCERVAAAAEQAVAGGARYAIVSDRAAGPDRAAVPSALACGAVHHRLLAAGLRRATALIAEAEDVRDSHHAACLITNGMDAVCPSLALASVADMAARKVLGSGVDSEQAQRHYVGALEDGVLKVMSKMGIAVIDSYRGAQIIEAIGLGHDVIELCFTGVSSVLGGLSFDELGADVILRHSDAFTDTAVLTNPGFIKHRNGGEYHANNPAIVSALQESVTMAGTDELAAHQLRRAVTSNPLDPKAYERFAALVNGRPPTEPRDLMALSPAGAPLPLQDVEPAASIARRFSTGAMSHGALSSEAHETLSLALRLVGGKANTGEGGEAPERYRDDRNSAIKQVASARFGVTPEYLAHADELQIKIAQGSKPGEGGQIPGPKVTMEIARLRHTVAGVPLISPPPHHDIYSIEDLAQLIFDLKQGNPAADVSVKLVASEGVGTIAAGVVKGGADVVHIAGGDGGTGASSLSSIKNAGMPWEIGLVETQSALRANALRGRVRLRVDGGLKTGRDVIVAALLGADEFSFGTAALLAEGCIMVRACHRNTCPVGIATQDPELRKKFAGTPEMVATYLTLVAEEVRAFLAHLGLDSLDQAIGRAHLLHRRGTGNVRADSLDVGPLLQASEEGERRCAGAVTVGSARSPLGDRIWRDAMPALRENRFLQLRYPISTSDRAVGTRLGCAIGAEMPPGTARGRFAAHLRGSAGQSFGGFLSDGVELHLVGEANDYVCKGMAGGCVVIRPPEDDAGDPYLVGNTVLYGATGGSLFVAGRAGERFAVRNSGAVAVVEGAGDHACEYMTAGAVIVLGPVGRNLAAGMSGGEVYVYDPLECLEVNLDTELMAVDEPTRAQLSSLRRIIHKHSQLTGGSRAADILFDWKDSAMHFRRVSPRIQNVALSTVWEESSVSAA